MNKIKTIIILTACIFVPGLCFIAVNGVWTTLVAPTLNVPIMEILDQNLLMIIMAFIGFLCIPSLCIFAVASFLGGLKIWLE